MPWGYKGGIEKFMNIQSNLYGLMEAVRVLSVMYESEILLEEESVGID